MSATWNSTTRSRASLRKSQRSTPSFHGLVHSIAFANYAEGFKPFHETRRADFLQAASISCYSLMAIANAFKNTLDKNASVVTISISTTRNGR